MPTNIIANLRINTSSAYKDLDAFKARVGGKTFSQPLGRISGDAAEFSKSLQAAAARVTAFGATTGAIYAVSKAISETAKATVEVNKQLVELNTFLGVSQVTLDKFGKTLFDISRQTGTPFSNVAEAAKEFARQGLSLEETSKRTKDALILARIAGISYGQAVNGITTAINSFNKEALDSTSIINKLIAVDTRFAVSAKDINEAFVRVGSAAEEAGISSNKLVAAITAAQQVTGRGGAVIGNALKTIFTRVQRSEVVDQLKDIGVAVTDQNGKLLDGIEILKNYASATRNLSQAEKSRADELLGGVYQINQLQGLIKDLTSANSVYTNSLRAASNATDEASKKNDELNKSLSAKITSLSNTALQAGAEIGKSVLQPLMEAGISVTDTILKALSPELYTDQAEKTSKAIGDSLGKNVAKGFGQFLVLAGGPVAAAFGASIFSRLLSFGKGAVASQLKQINAPYVRVLEGKPFFEDDYKKQLNLQNQITEAVIKSGAASGMTIGNVRQEAQARRILLQYLRQENQELERKAVLTQQATNYLSQRGVGSVTQVRYQPRNSRTGRFTTVASGYVPNFSMSEADQEVMEARSFGAKNPKAKIVQATIKGKTQSVMVNSEEDVVPNFAGTGETAIIPRYRKMQDIPRMAQGYVPNFAFNSLKTWYTRDRKILDPETYSYLRYALTKDKKAINLVFSKSEQKGQGWQMFEKLGKTAKRIGLPVKSDVLSSQANDVLDISDASLARAGKYGIEEVLKVAYPQLIYRQKGFSKNTSLSVNLDDGLNNTSTELRGKNIFSVVSEFASKQYKGDSKLLRNSIIDGSFDLQNVVTNFAGGRVPNFAASKFVQNIVNSYKASLTEKDTVRLGQAEKAASYYPIVNSELKALSGSSGIRLETLAYSLAALSGNTSDLDARRGLERIIKNQPYDDLAILPKNVEKVKKMIASSGSTTELMSILGKGAKTQNFAQSLLLSENFSGFGKYKNPIGTPSVMDSWAIYVRNGGALKDKYDRKAVSEKQKSKLFSQSASGYKYYNKLVKEYAEASKILGVPVRDLQARTWGWARGQMGSVTRNSFASGYVPNFANVNAEKLILGGQGPNLLLTSPYDSLKASLDPSSQISGGIGYGLKFPDRSYASTARSAGVDAMQALHDYAKKQGGRAYYAPHVPTGAISKYGTASGGMNKRNIFFLQQLISKNKKDFPRSFVQAVLSINPANASLIQTGMLYDAAVKHLSKKGLSSIAIGKKFREGSAGLHDPAVEQYSAQNKYSVSSVVSRVSDVGGSVAAPTSYHPLYPRSTYADSQISLSRGIDLPSEFERLTGVKVAANKLDSENTRYQPLASFLPFGMRFEEGDEISKMIGLAKGYVPNFAREKIIAAAFKTKKGNIFTGSYHGAAYEKIPEGENIDLIDGFVTNSGKFVDRKEAGLIAQSAHQLYNNGNNRKAFASNNYKLDTAFLPLPQEKYRSRGYIPNFSGLSQSISREKQMTGLPVSQIMAHFDGKGNPIAVTNKRDEPNGLKDVPNFAPPRGGGRGGARGGKGSSLTPERAIILTQVLNVIAGAVEAGVNVAAQNESISPETARTVSFAVAGINALIGISAGLKSVGGFKKATGLQRTAAIGLPLVAAAATAGVGYLGSESLKKNISQQKIQRESERVAQQFSDLTNSTQELSDTLSKLDAAYKDVSTNPDELLKLTKKSTELTTKISKTNPQLSAKLAAEPNLGRRIDLIQESNKEATSQQTVDQEILKLRSQGKVSNKELESSFNRLIGGVGEDIFKTKEGSVTEANLPEFLKKNKLENLSKFFDEQDKEVQSKLRPAFTKALNSQLKLNNEAEKYNKEVIRIQGDLFKSRKKVQTEKELRDINLAGKISNIESLQDFAQNFGSRAAISAKVDAYKTIEGLKPTNQFKQAINTQLRNGNFSPEITRKLSSIEGPGDVAKKQLEEIAATKNLTEEQKEGIKKLITQNQTSTDELKKISDISEINKNNQLRLLTIQEKLGFGGGIKTSIDAKSRVESINAPLRGALEYQIGAQLGSPRSMIAGQTNFLKSIQGLYPGLIDKTGGLAMASQRLSALRMGDLQLDLMKNAATAGRMGMPDVAAELMKKAFDPKALAEIAKTQTETELQTGKTPTEISNELKSAFDYFSQSLNETFKGEAEIRQKEKDVAQPLETVTKTFENFQSDLTKKIEAAFQEAFGKNGVEFKNSTIEAPNATVNVSSAAPAQSASSGAQQAEANKASMGGFSKGFIPSFYNPLREAIQRENKYVPFNSIRVNKSDKLINPNNPFGLAVTNTFDEPNGLASIGLASGGFVPNFAAFGSRAASEARNNARLGKLYVWDNIDNGFRKVNPSGTVDANLIDPKDLPKGARTISTELSQGGGKKSIIPLKDPKVTKLDELSLPGIARSQPIDKILSRLDRQGRLTPKNLLTEINKVSGGKDVVVKTGFGESNVQSKGVYGLGGKLSTADARSIIGKYTRGTGSGFFTQEKVPTYYNELRVHVAVDDKGNIKIIKGGTILKATGFDPSAGPSVKAYTDAGLSKNEAIKMSKSFRRSAEASAFDAIRTLVKTKGVKNAFFGVDVGGTTLQSALDAGVKTREFYSGGRGRVGTIVFEVNPSDKTGSTGFMGRGLSEKLVKNIFGQKPAPSGLTTGSPAIGINPTGNPTYPPIIRPSLSPSGAPLASGLPAGFSAKPSLASSIINTVKNQATLTKNSLVAGFQNMAGKAGTFATNLPNIGSGLGSKFSGLVSGAKGLAGSAGSNLMSFGRNALGKAGTGLTIAGSLGLGEEAYEALKRGEFGNAAVYGGASVGLGIGALNNIFGKQPIFNSRAGRYVDPTTGRFTSAPKTGLFGKFAGGASGIASALLSGAQTVEEIKNKKYGNAAVSGAQTALYIASALSKKATGAFGIASGLGLAKDIANAKNFELASDWSDVLFGKAEQGGGIADLVGTALTAASGPIGAGVATAKIGYRIGNVIENKLGLGDKLGNVMAGSEAATRAEFASLGMAKSIAKKDVIEGKQSASKYIESKRRDLEELSKTGAFKGDVIDTLNKDLDQIASKRKEREKAIEEKSRTDAIIAKRAEETKAREAGFKAEDEKRKEDQNKFDASLRGKIVDGVIRNEELSGLQTSRDKALYIIEQEKRFGKFSEADFGENKGLYDSYKNYSKESQNIKKKEDKFNAELMNPEAAGGVAYRTQPFREEQQRKVEELASFPKDAFEEAARRRMTVEDVMEERKKGATKNKFNGFIPNFAYRRERSSVLTSPDYVGYRNAIPEPSKYYKNVVKNTAEIEVPAVEVYNRMGLFGAQPKNASEKYAILNPAQQAQLGYAANGFIPNFAPEQFAGAISEALQQALSPMFEKMGSSVSNSNVINVHDQRSFDVTSDKVNGVMEFLQKQFPTQFARQMGPNKV